VKADIAIKDGNCGDWEAGNPDVQPGVDIIHSPGTEAIAGVGTSLRPAGSIRMFTYFAPSRLKKRCSPASPQ